VHSKEKSLRRINIQQGHQNARLKKDEQTHFVNSFAQAKNLIEKQMKVGFQIKEKNRNLKMARQRVQQAIITRKQPNNTKQAVKAVLYDDTTIEHMNTSKISK